MSTRLSALNQALIALGHKVNALLEAIWEASGAQITEMEAAWTPLDKPRKKHRAKR